MGLRVRRHRVLDVCIAKVLQGTWNPQRREGGFEERDGGKMNGAGQKTKKNHLHLHVCWQIPHLGELIAVLFKHSIDKAHSQYQEKSAVLLKVRPGDTGR